MILRSALIRHGRQVVVAARPASLRTYSTDRRNVFGMPTGYAEPPPPSSAEPVSFDQFAASNPVPEQTAQAGALEAADPHHDTLPAANQPARKKRWQASKRVKVDHSIALKYRNKQRLEKLAGKIGSVTHQRFNPHTMLQTPPRPEDVTLELLMSSQTHMGHHTALWNPANQRFIYGVREGIHIISLEETQAALRRCARVVEETALRGGVILYVGTRKGHMEIIARAAAMARQCHLFTKWVPGTLTNRDLLLAAEPLKIVDELDQTREGFDKHLLSRRPIMPDLVVVMNPLENHQLLRECSQEDIPTIGLIDTDANPLEVTYVIPGNDDSLRSVSLIAGVLGRAGERGYERRMAAAKKGIITWENRADIESWLGAQEENSDDVDECVAFKERFDNMYLEHLSEGHGQEHGRGEPSGQSAQLERELRREFDAMQNGFNLEQSEELADKAPSGARPKIGF